MRTTYKLQNGATAAARQRAVVAQSTCNSALAVSCFAAAAPLFLTRSHSETARTPVPRPAYRLQQPTQRGHAKVQRRPQTLHPSSMFCSRPKSSTEKTATVAAAAVWAPGPTRPHRAQTARPPFPTQERGTLKTTGGKGAKSRSTKRRGRRRKHRHKHRGKGLQMSTPRSLRIARINR